MLFLSGVPEFAVFPRVAASDLMRAAKLVRQEIQVHCTSQILRPPQNTPSTTASTPHREAPPTCYGSAVLSCATQFLSAQWKLFTLEVSDAYHVRQSMMWWV